MKDLKSYKSAIVNAIIIGLLTIGSSFVITVFSPDSFLVHPVFDIEPEPSPFENTVDIITIKNTGWVQAKNVEIDMVSFKNSKIISSYCPEGNIQLDSEWVHTHEISLERLSVNVSCLIRIDHNSTSNLYDIVVTADDSPAYKWFGESRTVESLSNPFDLMVYFTALLGVLATVIALFVQINERKRKVAKERRFNEFDPIRTKHCPNCGSVDLSRTFSRDEKRDDDYYDIVCNSCNWEDGGEL